VDVAHMHEKLEQRNQSIGQWQMRRHVVTQQSFSKCGINAANIYKRPYCGRPTLEDIIWAKTLPTS
jgi:hypothetical protein